MKICKNCNLSYDDDKKFCKKCGSSLVVKKDIVSKEDAKKIVFEDRLIADPLNVELLHEYSQFLFTNSIFNETVSVTLKLLAINEKDIIAKELLYKSYLSLNMLKEAMGYGKLLLSEKPNDISLLQELAEIAGKMENAKLETEFYNQILEIDPTHVDALLNKAHRFLEESQLEKALAIFGNLWDEGNTKDRVITIYAGIDKTLKSDYAAAIKLLRPILSKDEFTRENDIDTNRGILYLTYSLCQISEKLTEIKKWAIRINYDNLEQNHHLLDEKITFSVAEFIVNRTLNEVHFSNEAKKQITNLVESFIPGETYSKNYDLKLAEIWYAVGLKQAEFKLFADAIKSFSKAVELGPDETTYQNKLVEVKKQFDRQKRKRNKKMIFTIVASIIALIVIVFAFFAYKINEEKSAFETAKKINTENSYQLYIKKYPEGRYYIEAKQLEEEASWENAKKINTVEGYDKFLKRHASSKYLPEAHNLREDALWNFSQISKNFVNYINQYPKGKYIKNIKYNVPNIDKIKKDLIGHSIYHNSVKWNFDFLEEFKNFKILNSTKIDNYLEFNIDMILYDHTDKKQHKSNVIVTYSLNAYGWQYKDVKAISYEEIRDTRQLSADDKINDVKYDIPGIDKIKKDLIGRSISAKDNKNTTHTWTFAYLEEIKNFTIDSSIKADDYLELVIDMDLTDYINNKPYKAKIIVRYTLKNDEWRFRDVKAKSYERVGGW